MQSARPSRCSKLRFSCVSGTTKLFWPGTLNLPIHMPTEPSYFPSFSCLVEVQLLLTQLLFQLTLLYVLYLRRLTHASFCLSSAIFFSFFSLCIQLFALPFSSSSSNGANLKLTFDDGFHHTLHLAQCTSSGNTCIIKEVLILLLQFPHPSRLQLVSQK